VPRSVVRVAQTDVRLAIAPYDYAAAERLGAELGVSHVTAQVLVRRGFGESAAAREFLEAGVSHPLDAFGGLREGAAIIHGHVERGSRITVHGDYDVDGVSATAVLVRALRTLGAEVDWYLPSRIDDGYGLALATVERLAARGTELLVTVDCAITAVEEVAAARAAGMDVVVTDHHTPRADGRLPDAPIVHPGVGGYPCPELCAAGVAHLLARALLEAAGMDAGAAEADLDLVALATVADCVPLVGENRRLVRAGLRALASTRKPGLQALMDVARVDPSGVDASAIGFRLAPRINAAGRLHRADAGLELLLTADVARARAVAAELDAVNTERRDVETQILFAAEAQVAEFRAAAGGAEPAAYVLAGEGWHPGVIGIVASRIAERHHRPAVLIALDGEEGTGSGRSIPAFDLLGGLDAASAHLLRHGGHRAAAGCTIAAADVDAFRAAFVAHAEASLAPEDLVSVERVDAVVPGDVLALPLAEELQRLAPFGMGNPEPALLVPSALLDDPRPMGEGRHVSFTLAAGGARSRCVAFGRGSSLPAAPGEPVDAVVRLEINRYNGAVEPRLVLRHAQAARPAPIRVVGEPDAGEALLAELSADLDAPVLAAASPARVAPPASGSGADDRLAPSTFGSAVAAGPLFDDDLRGAADGLGPPPSREVRDARGGGIAGLLGGLVAGGEPVLAVAAHAGHRARALQGRVGGFDVTAWSALLADPGLAAGYAHVVAVDPPAHASPRALAEAVPGAGWVHLAWGEAEQAFAARVLTWELDLRAPLAEAYRALRAAARQAAAGDDLFDPEVSGAALAAALAGAGGMPRTGAAAGRLLRVLAELELVVIEGDDPLAVTVPPAGERTALERSPAFRAYAARLEDGLAHLGAPPRTVAPVAAPAAQPAPAPAAGRAVAA
jgi:single-stranded-DNA-specific exonuclease